MYRAKGKCYNVLSTVSALHILDDVVFWFTWNGTSIAFCYSSDNTISERKSPAPRNAKYVEIHRNLNVNLVKGQTTKREFKQT